MILIFLCGTMLPFILAAFLVGNYMLRYDRNEAVKNTQYTVSELSQYLDIYFKTPEAILEYYIAVLEDSGDSAYMEYVEKTLEQVIGTNPDIAGIMVASGDEIVLQAGVDRVSRDSISGEEWHKDIQKADGKTVFIGDVANRKIIKSTTESEDDLVSIGRSFMIPGRSGRRDGKKNDAVILLDLKKKSIEGKMKGLAHWDEGFILFADDQNNIIYAPDNEVAYKVDRESADASENGYSIIGIGEENYLISSCRNSFTGYRCIGMIPSSVYEKGRNGILQILITSTGVFALLVVFLAFHISKSFTVPLEKLRNLMDQVEEGDFTVRFGARYNDEIGELGSHFNLMVDHMDDLVNRLQAEKQFRLEAELNRLQEQIKPHFLYNTLDTINWLARAGQTDEVVQMVEALTNMFRLGLSKGRDYIPLRDEKTHVANYLYIQKARYGNKISYTIDIAEEWEDILVPKLILQPLVENAIYHGIKLKRGDGHILITGEQQGDIFCLSVRDDGAGVSPERLAALQAQLDARDTEKKNMGFGLFYIAERMRMYYGEESRTVIESEEGVYTTVSLMIPLKTIKREEKQDV